MGSDPRWVENGFEQDAFIVWHCHTTVRASECLGELGDGLAPQGAAVMKSELPGMMLSTTENHPGRVGKITVFVKDGLNSKVADIGPVRRPK
ncbi:hypothetical protein ACCD10_20300 [Pseudomonas sp. Pseusp122]